MAAAIRTADDVDFSNPEFWLRPPEEREAAFAVLRRERPISFHEEFEPPPSVPIPKGPGYWALTRHRDVLTASKDASTFCSGRGTNIPDLPEAFNEFFGSMINMDEPRHGRLRRIVSRGFTPRSLGRLEEDVQRRAKQTIDRVIDKGACDFVSEIAAPLPLEIICDLMGIPESEARFVFEKSNVILGLGDPEYVPEGGNLQVAALTAGKALADLMDDLAAHRRKKPTDDLTSQLLNAEIEDGALTQQELASFFVLLVVAGNETTRNAISHGMKALTDFPDQRRAWWDDFEGVAPTAIEEIVRWATPVIHFRRTATRDIDVTRTPNEHVGFGGPGPHHCLGANLARREMRVMFREIATRIPDLEITGPPEMLRSNFIHGIKRMPCAWRAGGR
jgi:cytochrome P450